jgi:hypothetical protein
MKLSEIARVVSQPNLGFDLSKIANFKIVCLGYLQDYTIELGSSGDIKVFIVKKDDSIIAALLLTTIDDLNLPSNKSVLMVKRSWCSPNYRRRGIIVNLYRFIYNTLNFALISDVEQSRETIGLWDKLRDQWPVKMIDLKTHEITDIVPVELYNNYEKALIVESQSICKKINGLHDYVFALHED